MMKRSVRWLWLASVGLAPACDDSTAVQKDESPSVGTMDDGGIDGDGLDDGGAPIDMDAGSDGAMPIDADSGMIDDMDASTPDAGDDTDADVPQGELEIEGRWHSNFGGTEVIDSDAWTSFGTASIVEYDNGTNYAVTQNPADATYNPSKFNKLVWTEITDGSFYYCTVDFGLDTAQEARDTTKTADDSAPENSGCGGFSWTKLSPTIEIEGTWTDGVADLTIDSDAWGDRSVVSYDNGDDSAVLQNDAGAAVDPSKFGKVVWIFAADKLTFCEVSSGRDTAEAAETAASMADRADLATGCNGGAWTELDAAP